MKLFNEVIAKLKASKEKFDPKPESVTDVPSYVTAVAAMHMRKNLWRNLFFAATGLYLLVIFGHSVIERVKEIVVYIPGAPEVGRVSPGQVPDSSVFLFAEHVGENLGSFNYQNVRYQYSKISNLMTPSCRGRFEMDTDAKIKDWTARRYVQSFSYDPVKSFDLEKDERGAKYVVAVQGTRTSYVEGHVFSETREVLLLEFRTRAALTAEKPWMFEIEKIDWLTPTQFEAVRRASLNNKGVSK